MACTRRHATDAHGTPRRTRATWVAALGFALGGCAAAHGPVDTAPDLQSLEEEALAPREFEPVDAAREAVVRARLCAHFERLLGPCDGETGLRLVELEVVESDPGPFHAAVLRATVRTPEFEGDVLLLEVRGGTTERLEPIGDALFSGQGGVSGEVAVVRFRWTEDDASTLEVVVESSWNDEDMGSCSRDGGMHRTLIVCSARPDGPACGALALRAEHYDEHETPCEGERPRLVSRWSGYEVSAVIEDGVVRLRRTRTSPERPPRALRRDIPLRRLVTGPSTRWPAPPRP